MKAIILAAGMGNRMRPLTLDNHKSMLEIAGKPIIRHQVDVLKSCNVRDINIVTGYREDDIKNCLLGEAQYSFNPFYENTNSVVSLWLAQDLLNDDVLIINSDVFFDDTLIDSIINNNSDISVAVSKEWFMDKKGYKVQLEGSKVVNMSMNIEPSKIGGEYAGMIKVSKKTVTALKDKLVRLMKEKQFNIWFEDVVVALIKEGAIANYISVNPDLWCEIDTVEELKLARIKFSKGGNVNVI